MALRGYTPSVHSRWTGDDQKATVKVTATEHGAYTTNGTRVTVCETTELACIGADSFSALDNSLGAAGDFHRLRQHEVDRRWQTRYLCATSADLPYAVIPMYRCLTKMWPDPQYDPARWRLPPGVADGCTPAQSVLVGGFTDLRSALHISGDAGPGLARRVLTEAVRIEPGRALVFPYLYAHDKDIVDQALPGAVAWTRLAREAHFEGIADPRREERLGSRVRGVLNHDRKLIEQEGVVTGCEEWDAVAEQASAAISDHNNRHGYPDHPVFVRTRHDQWADCDGVRIIVLTATCRDISGVLTALLWQDELELREVGINGVPGRQRLAVYVSLLFQQPLLLAAAHGVRAIRCGILAEKPKASRGAVFRDLYGGVHRPPGQPREQA